MATLESITVGSLVDGISAGETVEVVAVKWHGSGVLSVTFKNAKGLLGNQLIFRENEGEIVVKENHLPWSFDASGDDMRLASEAYRINLAHIFDPYLAVHTSAVEPLPHQISAVYGEMLHRLPLRYILADDPGAGKTIMTGLLLKELMIRGDLKRCLIVSPGSLSEQWQDELYSKFHLKFEILTNDRIESAVGGNVFAETNLCIARLDKLSRNDVLQDKLRVTEWDLIVVDEAHKMSASLSGGEIHYTKRFQLGRLLSGITRHFLLLTATPHNGKNEEFQLFMSLIDPDRFEGVQRTGNQSIDVSDVMRRLVKEDLLKFDGSKLFPERRAYTVNYDLSPKEAALYQEVTAYVQEEFNRADNLEKEHKSTVGFALTILQRRLASSPEAIYQSLHRRRERLESRLAEEKLGRRAREYHSDLVSDDDYNGYDDFSSEEIEEDEERVADQASAATTITELEAEIKTLKRLEALASQVRASGEDRKWDELSQLLQDNECMYTADGQQEKIIIFTEHRDTLRYLSEKIRSLLGSEEAVVTIHGGMLRDERRKVEELFRQDKEVRILVATDAAGEGINLQRAHLMVNYDLPWNPNRLEQRFGRIHRIGQTEVCHLWNLVSKETREGMVFQRLFQKLEEEREALHGKVFDILGKVSFDNRSLRDLLVEAIRYGNDPEVRERLWQVVDNSLETQKLRDLIDKNALIEDSNPAYKQSDTDEDDSIASSGWETMLTAIIRAGFTITGTWPMRTEMANRSIASGTNALASSIILVCRKRAPEAPICTRRNLIAELKRELRPALKKLQSSNIAPVDLAQSAIGPGMGVFSKYSKVLEADGTEMTVRSALQIINQELDIYFNEQDGELDRSSRFCVELYMQNAFNDMKYGDADTLARAKNTSVGVLASAGVVYSQKGIVHLLGREEIPDKVDEHESIIWLLTQQLTRIMEKEGVVGCAKVTAQMFGSNGDRAKDLAYRLFTIADKRGWAQETGEETEGEIIDIIHHAIPYEYVQKVMATPKPMPKRSYSSSTTKDTPSDPYDVYDYSDPDDFYYDHYDDFFDYEDAEDYFYEHDD